MAMRKMGSMAKPDVHICKDGDTVTVKTESTFRTSQFSFKLNEKFEENTLDGRKTQVSTSTFLLNNLKPVDSLLQPYLHQVLPYFQAPLISVSFSTLTTLPVGKTLK